MFRGWAVAGAGTGVESWGVGIVGDEGTICIGGGIGRGVKVVVAGSENSSGGVSAGLVGADGIAIGGGSVVKAPAALQALRLSALMALTLQ